MADVGVDLFDFGGKSHVTYVSCWSGYPLFSQLASSTSGAVIPVLQSWVNTLGWPR